LPQGIFQKNNECDDKFKRISFSGYKNLIGDRNNFKILKLKNE